MSSQSKMSTSVLTSSESDRDSIIPVTSSAYASSDLVGDIDNLNLEPCHVCTKKATNNVCHDCKGLHSLFSGTDKHSVVSIHLPCDPREEEKKTNSAYWYCNDCTDFLCNEHKDFKISKSHSGVHRVEKTKQGNIAQENIPTHEASKHREVGLSRGFGKQIETISKQERQAPLKTSTPFTARTVKAIGRFNIATSKDGKTPNVWSSAFLPDSRLLIADNSNSTLKVFDAEFQLIQEKTFHSVFCVSVFDTSEVAVLYGDWNITRLSFIEEITEKGRLQLQFESYSMAYVDRDRLAVTSVRYPAFVCMYSTGGTELFRISADTAGKNFAAPFNVTVDRERSMAYVADCGRNIPSVCALDLTGSTNPAFSYMDKSLKWPGGVGVDQDGNIYVCDTDSHNIHQISPRGDHIRILLSQKNGLQSPRSISFASDGITFIVTMDNNTTVLLFKME